MSPVPRETPSNDLISHRVVARTGSHLKTDTFLHPRPPRKPFESFVYIYLQLSIWKRLNQKQAVEDLKVRAILLHVHNLDLPTERGQA